MCSLNHQCLVIYRLLISYIFFKSRYVHLTRQDSLWMCCHLTQALFTEQPADNAREIKAPVKPCTARSGWCRKGFVTVPGAHGIPCHLCALFLHVFDAHIFLKNQSGQTKLIESHSRSFLGRSWSEQLFDLPWNLHMYLGKGCKKRALEVC